MTDQRVKIYSRHNCTRHHRSGRTFAQCAIRRPAWITGRGDYAVISYCGQATVTLHSTFESAELRFMAIEEFGCAHHCIGRHTLAYISLQHQKEFENLKHV